jgi:hypothetical protein
MRDTPPKPQFRKSRDAFRMNRSQFGMRLTNDTPPRGPFIGWKHSRHVEETRLAHHA